MGVETLVFIFTNSVLGKGCRDSYFACATGNVISSDECAAVSVSTSKCSAYLMAAGIHFLHIYIYIYIHTHTYIYIYIHTHTHTHKNGAVSKVNKKFISHLTRAQPTPSAAATVQVSHALTL